MSKLARAELQARLRTALRLDRQGGAEPPDAPPAPEERFADYYQKLAAQAPRPPCPHEHLVTFEGTGVACEACDLTLGSCGEGGHVSERLWNRACANDKEAPPCEQDRETHCAICGDLISPPTKEPT